jgi:N6-adenosine-specific RNA methylase IME4
MKNTFTVIVADPCWSFSDKLKMSDVKRGASSNYPTMTIADFKNLPVKELIDPKGSVLCLWVPSSLLQEGLDLMSEWGFAQKQTYIFTKVKRKPLKQLSKQILQTIKLSIESKSKLSIIRKSISSLIDSESISNTLSFGLGRLFRNTHEICLIGTSNNLIYQQLSNKSQRSVCFAPNLKHSAKPEDLQNSLELMFPKAKQDGKMLELFARRERAGWICLGNECGAKQDIRISLPQLINKISLKVA